MRRFFLVFVIAISYFGFGQTQQFSADSEKSGRQSSLQISPFSWGFGKIGVQYEHQILENASVSLDVSYKLSGGLTSFSGIESTNLKTDDFGFKGMVLTPAYRWYFQKKKQGMRGLYIGGYYRFKHLNDRLTGSYTSSVTGTTGPLDIDASISGHTLGVEFGYKWQLDNHFFIDFLIAAPGMNFSKINLKENKPIPVEFYIDAGEILLTNFTLLEMALDLLDTELSFPSSGADKGKDAIALPAFRYNISIGYQF